MKIACAVAAAIALSSCGSPPSPPPAAEVVVWKEVGSRSGRGNFQSESFTSDTGGFRVRWETRNETVPGAGYHEGHLPER